jgi:LysM repeat protein
MALWYRFGKTHILLLLVFTFVWFISPQHVIAQEQTHTVQSGENLFRIALRYGINMNELASANNITDMTRVYAGQTLVIPGLSAVDSSDEVNNPLIATAPITHVVQRGEILSRIAQQYGVTVADILSANNITNANRIEVGQTLQIWSNDVSVSNAVIGDAITIDSNSGNEDTVASAPQGDVASNESTQITTHLVQRGEYLSQIAGAYGVSWTDVAELNGITDPNRVFAGMTLQIPVSGTSTIVASSASTSSNDNLGIVNTADSITPRWGVGREILVDLSTQMVYAFEDGVLQHSALSSTGLPATPTVQGDFNIWHKTPAQTMSGPGYYLPNVEWVMYFYQGYGLHGTYWHTNFGQPMSHGCVNLTNADAQWFYNFASLGTPVHVRW